MSINDNLPESVEIGGYTFPINTDFRAGMEFELMIQKGEKNIFTLLRPFFEKGIPRGVDIERAFDAVELFYCCGALPERKEKISNTKQAYSFDVDKNAIYADFWRFYNINLWTISLHWWMFRALLDGLPNESEFRQRIYYRTVELKTLSKREKERVSRIRKLIAIEDTASPKMTLAERNNAMLAYIQRRAKETAGGG